MEYPVAFALADHAKTTWPLPDVATKPLGTAGTDRVGGVDGSALLPHAESASADSATRGAAPSGARTEVAAGSVRSSVESASELASRRPGMRARFATLLTFISRATPGMIRLRLHSRKQRGTPTDVDAIITAHSAPPENPLPSPTRPAVADQSGSLKSQRSNGWPRPLARCEERFGWQVGATSGLEPTQ